jgi:hypothetical protein
MKSGEEAEMGRNGRLISRVGLLVLVLVGEILYGYGVAISEAETPIKSLDLAITRRPTLAPTLTLTPTSMPTPTSVYASDPLLGGLTNQLSYFIGGAGGAPLATFCRQKVKAYWGSKPVIFRGRWNSDYVNTGTVCIYGLRVSKELKINFTNADERKIGSGTFVIDKRVEDIDGYPGAILSQIKPEYIAEVGEMVELPGGTLIQVNLWLPPGITDGDWNVQVSSGKAVKGEFDAIWPVNLPVLYTMVQKVDPFTRPENIYHPNTPDRGVLYTLKSGQSLNLHGMNIQPNREIPLAFYLANPYQEGDLPTYRLIRAQTVKTDSGGNFKLTLKFNLDDPPGVYMILGVTNLKGHYAQDLGPFVYVKWQP